MNLAATVQATAEFTYLGDGNYDIDHSCPLRVDVSLHVTDLAAAEEFVSRFPKSLRFSATTLSSLGSPTIGCVRFSANLTPTKGNARNETGIRRYRRALELLEAAGVEISWRGDRYANAYPTRESFETAIA